MTSPPSTLSNPLAALLREEARESASLSALLDDLAERLPLLASLFEFLGEKERSARETLALRAEEVVLRRLGWRLVRPLFIVALLGGAAFVFQRGVDPVLGCVLFLAGAGAMHVAVQVALHLRVRGTPKRLAAVEARWRERVLALLERGPDRSRAPAE